MIKYTLSILTASAFLMGNSLFAEENQDEMKQISKTMGHFVIENMQMQNMDIDVDAFIEGVRDAQAGKEAPLDKTEFMKRLMAFRQKAMESQGDDNLKAAEEFLTENKGKTGVISLEDGKLQYEVLEEGSGEEVKEDAAPLVHYEGKFIDGKVFDSTHQRGQPLNLSLKNTVKGFQEGIAGMKVGEKRRLWIHPDLGYGKAGRLPPNSLLIFDVEVIEADKAETPQPAEPTS